MDMDVRHCRECKRFLPHSAFYAAPRRNDGLDTLCQSCRREKNNAHARNMNVVAVERVRAWRRKNPARFGAYMLDWRRRLRDGAFAALGGACACCGERENAFLQVDHVRGDGAADRKVMKRSQQMLYAAVTKADAGVYRLLCANCHFAHSYRGGCPHELARVAEAALSA